MGNFQKFLLLSILSVLLFGCAETMSTTGEYTIDSMAYTALTTEKLVLSRPCTSTVTTVCVDKKLAQTLKDSRILLMVAVEKYQTARDAYLASMQATGQGDSAAVAAASAALRSAITDVNTVLATELVQSILSKIEE